MYIITNLSFVLVFFSYDEMSASSAQSIKLFEMIIPSEAKQIKEFEKSFKGMIFFDHNEKDRTVYLVVSDLTNAKLLRSITGRVEGSISSVENIADVIVEQNEDCDFSTITVPLANLMKFNSFFGEEISSSLELSVKRIIRSLHMGIAPGQFRVQTRFFKNQKTNLDDGVAYINFDSSVDKYHTALILYVLRKMRWNLPLNELDSDRNNTRTYCKFKWINKSKKPTEKEDKGKEENIEESELESRTYQSRPRKVFKERPQARGQPKETKEPKEPKEPSTNTTENDVSDGEPITDWGKVEQVVPERRAGSTRVRVDDSRKPSSRG